MALFFGASPVRCPNCEYEGPARLRGPGCGLWLLLLTVFLVSFSFPPLFLVFFLMGMWLLLKRPSPVCRKCGYEHPIPQ
ncbi:MAG: hypothetical protein QF819_00645 [Gemmatimonadota bacterium]|jgi:hypothetical protein|nr:hypothetical protein [Gemmatimonadota bacterium]MDP6528977.1 hypothetical protein [Gemmatimonadota bacterium]MDP6801673.1 hypothetical protein [Gemmatimonadota bacterium]MDP7030780.1 hypothetical protein [Gemmatimonadota bacterium]